ncbi:MAG: hypothetical protein ACI81S_002128 [Sphingobacteriales bacterium]|jgi:hypothetical protein
MRKLILLLIVLLPILSHSQDIVFLKSGEQFNGKIISINENKVVVQNKENQITFLSKDVVTVRYGDNNNGLISAFHKTDSIVGRMIPSFTAINKFSHNIEINAMVSGESVRLEITDFERINSNLSYGLGISIGKAMNPFKYTNFSSGEAYPDEDWDNAMAFAISPTLKFNSNYLLGFASLYFQIQTGPALFSDYYGGPKPTKDEVERKLRFGWHFSPTFGLDFKINNLHVLPVLGAYLFSHKEINGNNSKVKVLRLQQIVGIKLAFDINRKSNKAIIKDWLD